MLPRLAYLEFATRWYGHVRFDLASSGVSPIAQRELGAAPVDDYAARQPFVEGVAARYGVEPRAVIPCLGASGALFTAFATLLGPGDEVLVETPSYEPVWRIPEALGATVRRFERGSSNVVVTPKTRVVAITNPHNPTGSVMDDAELAELSRALGDVWLLVDEAYMELSRPAHTAFGGRVITCSSATKCFGVPWARAGFLLVPPELEAAARGVEALLFGSAPPGCWAYGALAFERADHLLARAHALQAGKRALVDAFIRDHGLSWSAPPETSLYGWVHTDAPLGDRIERGILERGVIVAPGEFFGDPAAFRLSWSADSETLVQGLEHLGAVLKS